MWKLECLGENFEGRQWQTKDYYRPLRKKAFLKAKTRRGKIKETKKKQSWETQCRCFVFILSVAGKREEIPHHEISRFRRRKSKNYRMERKNEVDGGRRVAETGGESGRHSSSSSSSSSSLSSSIYFAPALPPHQSGAQKKGGGEEFFWKLERHQGFLNTNCWT